jgi:hypothetical protein
MILTNVAATHANDDRLLATGTVDHEDGSASHIFNVRGWVSAVEQHVVPSSQYREGAEVVNAAGEVVVAAPTRRAMTNTEKRAYISALVTASCNLTHPTATAIAVGY